MDGRKNNGGARRNAGRKSGIGITNDIKKHCEIFINELLKDDAIRVKATKQLSLTLGNTDLEDYLYIIENNGSYKIGYSSDWSKRIKAYKSHLGNVNVVYVTKQINCFNLENYLHAIFKEQRLDGEWFNLDQEDILEAIKYCSIRLIK